MGLKCKSVVGGWQTFEPSFGILIGLVFNKVTDLWEWQGANIHSDSDVQNEIEDALLKKFPHSFSRGFGIDSKWEFKWQKNGKVKASNSFHCMNEVGDYDGYADFTLIIPPVNHTDFKLMFHGRQGQNKNRQYLLRDYLEDIFVGVLEGLTGDEEHGKEVADGASAGV